MFICHYNLACWACHDTTTVKRGVYSKSSCIHYKESRCVVPWSRSCYESEHYSRWYLHMWVIGNNSCFPKYINIKRVLGEGFRFLCLHHRWCCMRHFIASLRYGENCIAGWSWKKDLWYGIGHIQRVVSRTPRGGKKILQWPVLAIN